MASSIIRLRFQPLLLLVAALAAVGGICRADGQAPTLASPSASFFTSRPISLDAGGSDAWRRQIEVLTERLADQQRQIEQQNWRLEQLQQILFDQKAGSTSDWQKAVPVSAPQELTSTKAETSGEWTGEEAVSGGDASPHDADCGSCGPGQAPEAWESFCRQAGDPGGSSLSVKIGGQYRLIYDGSNFDFHSPTISKNQSSQNFFNQRFRTWVEMHTRPDVGVYFQVEMGHILWGAAPDFPKTYPGPFSGPGDRVGVELRRGYLIYGTPETGVWRAGIQDWHDAFGESYTLGTFGALDDYDSFGAVLANSIWDFNVGGLSYAGPAPGLPDVNLNAGMFVLWEGNTHKADDAFLLAFDLDRPWSDKDSIGFSVYYLVDRGQYSYPITLPGGGAFTYDSAWDLWIGVRASTVLWKIPARGFAIFNTGGRKETGGLPRFRHDDVALKLELGPVSFGPGKVSFQTLFSTGDGNADETRRDSFRTIAQSARDNFGAQGYWSYLILTSPHGPSDVNDLGVSLQNRGLGLFTVQAKYAYLICDRLSGVLAIGWLQSDAANPTSNSRDMGTEIANMFAYDFGRGLTLDFGAAVLFTGDFYRQPGITGAPEDLWEVFSRLQLEF